MCLYTTEVSATYFSNKQPLAKVAYFGRSNTTCNLEYSISLQSFIAVFYEEKNQRPKIIFLNTEKGQ